MPTISLTQLRTAARKRLIRLCKTLARGFYFAFDVHYYLQQGHRFRRACELARDTIYH